MGREIRRVIPNWGHPKNEHGRYQPMYDQVASESFAEWLEVFEEFKIKKLHEVAEKYGYDINDPYSAYCDYYGSAPDHKYYRPKWDETQATWWQLYETVSEGTPLSPPFETQDELIDYLVKNGDFWDQKSWSREVAEKFVNGPGWAPSFVISNGEIKSGVEAVADG